MSDAIDPSQAFVLAVGIERYAYGTGMDLPGAASDAERFARWAVEHCRIDPERVQLACSWLDETLAKPVEGVEQIGTTRQDLEDAVVNLGDREEELLLVYWCGHGLLNERRERVLFSSDARARNKRNIAVDELLAYLACDRVRFRRQILLFDSCANFVEDMRFDEALPRATLPKGTAREVAQFSYFAAAQGQIAGHDRTERTGHFSETVLAWLEQQSPATLPPDVTSLTEHVDETFEALAESGALRQTPVYRSVRPYFGEDDGISFAGGSPVTGVAQAAAREADLTVMQMTQVAEAVAGLPMLGTPAARRELAATLEADGTASDYDIADMVARALRDGRGAALFDALRERVVDDRERDDVRLARDGWRRHEWVAPALRCFSFVTAEQIRDAYYRAMPDDTPAPRDLDAAMDGAAAYGMRADGEAPLHKFVARLEHTTGVRVPDGWYGLVDGSLAALRETAAAPIESPRLIVDLTPEGDSWPSEAVGHLYTVNKGWSRCSEPCEPTIAGAQKVVAKLLQWARSKGIGSFTVGLIVPRSGFDAIPESWAYGSKLKDPTPLWDEQPVVLHCAERRIDLESQALWIEKADAIKARLANHAPDIAWIEAAQRLDPAGIRTSVRNATGSCFGLAFAPGVFCDDPRRDPIIQMVVAGAPYVLWTEREPADWEDTRRRLLELVSEGSFQRLPERLGALRSAGGNGLGHDLRLVWDEPAFLPEDRGPLEGVYYDGGQDG